RVACGIRPDHFGAGLLGQLPGLSKPFGNRRVRQDELAALTVDRFCDLPGNARVIQGTEDDALFAVQQSVSNSGHSIAVSVCFWGLLCVSRGFPGGLPSPMLRPPPSNAKGTPDVTFGIHIVLS